MFDSNEYPFYNTHPMDKNSWLTFLSSKIRAQISLEAVEKAQNWALVLFGFLSLGFALSALGGAAGNPERFTAAKVLFLFFFHFYVLTQFIIPGILQKGQKPIARMLQIRDFSNLITVTSILAFYSLVALILSFQIATSSSVPVDPYDAPRSNGFLAFAGWINVIASGATLAGFLFYLTSLFNFPQALIKWVEKGSKTIYAGFILSVSLLIVTGIAFSGVQSIGSADFFQTLQIAGLFWIFIGASVLLAGRVNRESALPALSTLEIDLVSGRLERPELVIPRFKDAFISARFEGWLKKFALQVVDKSTEIGKYTKEAVSLVSVEKPSELDLRQVEERYRKSEQLYRQLEKSHQRFMVSLVAFMLTEVETEKAALVRDQFSRELRNAKLELATVRKMIDERLVSLKNSSPKLSASTPSERQALEELTLKS